MRIVPLVSKRYQKSVLSSEKPWYIRLFWPWFCSCKFRLSSKRQSSLSSHLSPFPLPKTERKKDQKKEKIEKFKRKKKTNFLEIFPVDPPIFLSQKEEKREEITKFSFSISHSWIRKNREKKREKGEKTEEKKQKGRKMRRKRRAFQFYSPSPSPPWISKWLKKRRRK